MVITYEVFMDICREATNGCPRGWPGMIEVATGGVINRNMISGIKTRRAAIKKPEQVEAILALQDAIEDGSYVAPTVAPKNDKEVRVALAAQRDANLSDEDLKARTAKQFDSMETFVKLAITGAIRSVIVMGPPGSGKTFPIRQLLARCTRKWDMISGSISAVQMYKRLHDMQDGIVVFDDADAIFDDINGLNLLKAATAPRGKRWVTWDKQGKLQEEGYESTFEFKGQIIVITNTDMQAIADGRSKRAAHIGANLDRFHKVDLQLTTARAMRLRVEDMLDRGMLESYFAEKGVPELHDQAVEEFKAFLEEAQDAFKNGITLREMDKFTDLYVAARTIGADWKDLALTSLGA